MNLAKKKISKNMVVSVAYKLSDAQGHLIEEGVEPMVYLHGGYDGIFPKIEAALEGHELGFETQLQLEPNDAFGEYDPELIKVEMRSRFPETLTVGMQFEGMPEVEAEIEGEEEEATEPIIYTVTDIAEDKVVLDGNHPLAGIALRFILKVTGLREASTEEIKQEYADTSKLNGLNPEANAHKNNDKHLPPTLH